MKTHLLKLLVALAACLLVSCIDGREEYWFNASGGGHARLIYHLPAVAAEFSGGEAGIREKIGEFLKDNAAFTSSSYQVITVDDRLQVTVDVAFRSARDLQKLSTETRTGNLPDSARFFSGDTHLEMKGLTLDFTRRMTPGKAIPGAIFMPRRELDGHSLTYIFHLPMEAIESNATRTTDGGKTLIWEIPLAKALREPIITRFKARIPLPRWLLATGGSVFLLLGGILWKMHRKKVSL